MNSGIGRSGVALAIVLALAMCVFSLLFHPVVIPENQYGLAFPSPDSWEINRVASWIINTLILGLITILLYLINRTYNFIRTTEPALPALMLVLGASAPWFTQALNTSMILCLVNVACLGIIYSSYDSKNATQIMFILGVAAGIGAMFQYAFLPMALVYFLWSVFMRVMRIKETLAFIIGLVCPYWIAVGFGWLRFSDFHFPSITPLFGLERDHSDFIILLCGVALAAAIGFIIMAVDFMKLYAGNSKVNAMNLCVSLLGAAAVICIIVDFDNMPAYVITLYMTTAVQLANICALWNPSEAWSVTVFPAIAYIALYVCSLVF